MLPRTWELHDPALCTSCRPCSRRARCTPHRLPCSLLAQAVGLAVGVALAREALVLRAEAALAGVRARAVGVLAAEGERDVASAHPPAVVREDVMPRPDVVHVGVDVVRVVIGAVLQHVADAVQAWLVRVGVGRAPDDVVGVSPLVEQDQSPRAPAGGAPGTV